MRKIGLLALAACTIDDAKDGNTFGLAVDSAHASWLTMVWQDKRAVPLASFQFHPAGNQNGYIWETDELVLKLSGYVAINWQTGGYRLDLSTPDNTNHFSLAGQCRQIRQD
jgi:hypothetical protein